ncbi:MAG: arginyltransferase, partial [Alphaproteobacteria bacterium]
VCPGCQACVPIRVVSEDFVPDRPQRRILRANADLAVSEMPARATAEQFTLFQRYQKNRHADGDMAAMGYYDYRAMIEDTPISTGLLEFRDAQDRLLGACLTDWLADGLSAVYSFFDTDEDKRSLGTFAVLWLIGRARSLGLPYVYLGYWVPESRKMAYKARFRPSEILISGAWHRLDDGASVATQREMVRVG